ncbi:hypothetical protein DR79_1292 [Francisella tularensis]|nr:hypothetical protein NE061598_07860 [Francisella tularensis subsp. tularensis NE061598]EKM86127.1 hypothetical protein B343_08003 [Francisella tularensis subsp. tularensis 80700075]EOA41511.1 hypothetical protein H647_08045 [Francisella tularensis subsp. tularensis 80700069]EOA41990.1 hypothetical protein H646_08025 [Francisella tularensis subsp. tularensis 79201237]EOA46139.1 hypothetical protein H643_08037 [Francisella tularensis subsp. tularensis 1378]KFJ44092.1 hypothetical protein DR79
MLGLLSLAFVWAHKVGRVRICLFKKHVVKSMEDHKTHTLDMG